MDQRDSVTSARLRCPGHTGLCLGAGIEERPAPASRDLIDTVPPGSPRAPRHPSYCRRRPAGKLLVQDRNQRQETQQRKGHQHIRRDDFLERIDRP